MGEGAGGAVLRFIYVEECRKIVAADVARSDDVQEALGDEAEGLFSVRVDGSAPLALVVGQTRAGAGIYWWECPVCRRLLETLFQTPVDLRWACRECHDLRYQIRQEHDRRTADGQFAADVRPERKRHRRKT